MVITMDDFQNYLYRNYESNGIYSFRLYITKVSEGFCDFYIRPDKRHGEEAGFRVKVDTVFSDPEMI